LSSQGQDAERTLRFRDEAICDKHRRDDIQLAGREKQRRQQKKTHNSNFRAEHTVKTFDAEEDSV
jgi:hypothetical protein